MSLGWLALAVVLLSAIGWRVFRVLVRAFPALNLLIPVGAVLVGAPLHFGQSRATLAVALVIFVPFALWTLARGDGGAPVPSDLAALTRGLPQQVLPTGGAWIRALCTVRSRDRILLAAAGAGGVVQLWDPADGHLVHRSRWHGQRPVSDRRRANPLLASVGDDGTVALWEPGTGSLLRQWQASPVPVHALCSVDLDGRAYLCTAGDGVSVALWDPASGERRGQAALGRTTGWVRSIRPVQVGRRTMIATVGCGRGVSLVDPQTMLKSVR